MASLSALNSALSGLRMASSNISVISNNISNVNTAGYTKKSQEQYTVVSQGMGIGVNSGVIQRAVDSFLLRELNDQRGVTAGLETQQSYLQQILEFHGAAEQESAISSQIGNLKDSFQELANDPSKEYLLNDVYQQAFETVNKFSDFSDLITRLRNNAQTEMDQIVTQVNSLTEQIKDLNLQIKAAFNVNRPTADLEDQRDIALAEIAEYIDVSYYERSDKVMVVQTQQGTPLASDTQRLLYFNPSSIGPAMSYPTSVAAIRVDDPVTGVNLTDQSGLGGKLGALTELRDTTLPQYQAQLDEMAFRMAQRFDSQGLRLFSLPNETLPIDDATQSAPLGYVGFSSDMVINPDVVADKTLIRSGTTGNTVATGSSEVVRKIVEFAFSDVAYQQATGTVDMSGANTTIVAGSRDISVYGALENDANITAGQNFVLTVGGVPQNITIGAGHTAADLVNTINGVFPGIAQLSSGGRLNLNANPDITIANGTVGAAGLAALGLTAGTTNLATADNIFGLLNIAPQTQIIGSTDIQEMTSLDKSDYITPLPAGAPSDTFTIAVGGGAPVNIVINAGDTAADLVNTINASFSGLAKLGPNGNLILESSDTIAIGTVNIPTQGLADLGLTTGTYTATNPDFSVQVGNKSPVNIEILPTDTTDSLLTKLNAISGLTASFTVPDGYLQFQPTEGGDITLTDGLGSPLNTMGMQVNNVAHTSFSNTNLGPGGTVPSSSIGSAITLVDYATQIVSKQSQDLSNIESRVTSEQVYHDTLNRRLQDESGVNIDEEMAALVQIQNNYSAAAKAIQVIEEMFNTLMQSVLR